MNRFFVSKARVCTGDYGLEGRAVGVVEMTPELAKIILKRKKIFEHAAQQEGTTVEDGRLWEMYFWGGYCSWFEEVTEEEILDDQYDELIEGNTLFLEKSPFPEDRDEARTECDQMIIRSDEVAFTAIVKHTDIYIVTDAIKYADIEKFLKED